MGKLSRFLFHSEYNEELWLGTGSIKIDILGQRQWVGYLIEPH